MSGTDDRAVAERGTAPRPPPPPPRPPTGAPERGRMPVSRILREGDLVLRPGEALEIREGRFEDPETRAPRRFRRYLIRDREGRIARSFIEFLPVGPPLPPPELPPVPEAPLDLPELVEIPGRRPPVLSRRQRDFARTLEENSRALERERAEEKARRERDRREAERRRKLAELVRNPPPFSWTWEPGSDRAEWVAVFEQWERSDWGSRYPKELPPGAEESDAEAFRRREIAEAIAARKRDFARVIGRVRDPELWRDLLIAVAALEGQTEAGKLARDMAEDPVGGYRTLRRLAKGRIAPGMGPRGALLRFPVAYRKIWRTIQEFLDAFGSALNLP